MYCCRRYREEVILAATDIELIERAKALVPAIKARAESTEKLRKVDDETIRELAEAEILQMFVPKRWGGSEASFDTMRQVVEIISSACVSTGWITAFYIGHNVYVARFSEQAQEELYGPRGYVLMPAATAPNLEANRVDGGWTVSGRAIWGSGVMHADWVQISGRVGDSGRSFLVPISEVQVVDTWDFAGAAGTGSNDYVVENVFVPEHRSLDLQDFNLGQTEGAQLHANPLYAAPFLMLAYCTIVPVVTGGLTGALEEFENMIARRVRNFTGVVVKDLQHAHIMLGEMEIGTRIARELGAVVYETAMEVLATGDFAMDDRVAMKGRVAFLSNHCRRTVNEMMSNAGASSYHLSQPLQRFWRDLNTICSHAFWDWDSSREIVGRHKLQLPVQHPLV